MRKTRIGMMGLMVLACGLLMAQQPADTNGVADGAAVEARDEAAPAGTDFTFFELLVKGGPLMYPLCLCSIIMVAFAIERGINLRRSKILPPDTLGHLRGDALARRGSVWQQELLREFSGQPSPIARILTAGLKKAGKTPQDS